MLIFKTVGLTVSVSLHVVPGFGDSLATLPHSFVTSLCLHCFHPRHQYVQQMKFLSARLNSIFKQWNTYDEFNVEHDVNLVGYLYLYMQLCLCDNFIESCWCVTYKNILSSSVSVHFLMQSESSNESVLLAHKLILTKYGRSTLLVKSPEMRQLSKVSPSCGLPGYVINRICRSILCVAVQFDLTLVHVFGKCWKKLHDLLIEVANRCGRNM